MQEPKSQNLTAAAIEARRAYKRKWRERNKEHIKQYNAKYWAEKAASAKKAPQE